MNSLLLAKLIKCNNESCPEFTYSNPLLDRNVANALSKSLVKILKISTCNSNVTNSLRLSVLENIRKLCVVHPENHLKIDDNLIELLIELYEKRTLESIETAAGTTEKALENFLITNYKELNLNSTSKSCNNPEILQALLNLNNNKFLNIISNTIIHWNSDDPKYLKLAKGIWNDTNNKTNLQNTVSLKIKCEIEKNLLEIACYILENKITDLENVLAENQIFNSIIKVSQNSCHCFQICCGIFNHIFISTNFDLHILKLIQLYIRKQQSQSQDKSISFLYPVHLIHIVVLIDIDIINIPLPLKDIYIQSTIENLKQIHMKSETDLIMLLSHYPNWFDIYFTS